MRHAVAALALVTFAVAAAVQTTSDHRLAGFKTAGRGASAHMVAWTNGNVTEISITKDLECYMDFIKEG